MNTMLRIVRSKIQDYELISPVSWDVSIRWSEILIRSGGSANTQASLRRTHLMNKRLLLIIACSGVECDWNFIGEYCDGFATLCYANRSYCEEESGRDETRERGGRRRIRIRIRLFIIGPKSCGTTTRRIVSKEFT